MITSLLGGDTGGHESKWESNKMWFIFSHILYIWLNSIEKTRPILFSNYTVSIGTFIIFQQTCFIVFSLLSVKCIQWLATFQY